MNGKAPALISALLLIGLIGFMSWHSMHPRPLAENRGLGAGYFLAGPVTPAAIPDDNLPLVIFQGAFDRSRKDVQRPVTIAQRQVGLLFTLDHIPTDADFSRLDALLQGWGRQGTVIGPLYLDYRPERPDFAAYGRFIGKLREHLKRNPHLIIPVVDAAWNKADIRHLQQEGVPYFLLTADNDTEAATAAQFGLGFQLKLSTGMEPPPKTARALRENKFFEGWLATLNPQKPLAGKEPVISLFPKL